MNSHVSLAEPAFSLIYLFRGILNFLNLLIFSITTTPNKYASSTCKVSKRILYSQMTFFTVIILMLLLFSGCGGDSANTDAGNTVNVNAMNTNSGNITNKSEINPNMGNTEIGGERIMTKVEVMANLEKAIDDWSGVEAASYGPATTLSSLWVRKHPTIKYFPVGIDRLNGRIKQRFEECKRADNLRREMFHDEGIRTVGHLYDYLEPCGS